MDMRVRRDRDYDRQKAGSTDRKMQMTERFVERQMEGQTDLYRQIDTKCVDIQSHRLELPAFSLPNAEQEVLSYGPATFCSLCHATVVWV